MPKAIQKKRPCTECGELIPFPASAPQLRGHLPKCRRVVKQQHGGVPLSAAAATKKVNDENQVPGVDAAQECAAPNEDAKLPKSTPAGNASRKPGSGSKLKHSLGPFHYQLISKRGVYRTFTLEGMTRHLRKLEEETRSDEGTGETWGAPEEILNLSADDVVAWMLGALSHKQRNRVLRGMKVLATKNQNEILFGGPEINPMDVSTLRDVWDIDTHVRDMSASDLKALSKTIATHGQHL